MTGRLLITGNEACGEGALRAGCGFYAGYPITPQNELIAHMSRRLDEENGVFIQSESEIAAINMVFGGAVAGARSITTSSSPGISLMQEGISYLAGAELPAVIVNVMRGGPGLGNIAASQADYFQATKGGGHGDYNMVILAPAGVQEMFDLAYDAFDIAERYKNPVMLLTDGIIGQMMEPIVMSKKQKIDKPASKKWALCGCKDRKPRIIRSLFLKEGVLEELNIKLQKKFEKMRTKEIRYEEYKCKDAKFIIAAYGTCSRIARAVVDEFREKGEKVGLFRPISLWPFPYNALKQHDTGKTEFLTLEMNAGQMIEDVKLAIEDSERVNFYGRMGGGVPEQEKVSSILQDIIGKTCRKKR